MKLFLASEEKPQNSTIKKAKGVKQEIVQKELKYGDYENVLRNCNTIIKRQTTIQSNKFHLYKQSQNKIALTLKDDKRIFLDDASVKTESLAYGHYNAID